MGGGAAVRSKPVNFRHDPRPTPCANKWGARARRDEQTIDWAATGGMLQGIGTISGALAVAGAAWWGSKTYESWRDQKLSERLIDQAATTLSVTYKARRALQRVRSPVMFPHELAEAEKNLRDSGVWENLSGEVDQRKYAYAQAYYNRLHATANEQDAIEACQPLARALFGEELERELENLSHQFRTVAVYVAANRDDNDGADREFRKKIERAIWAGYPRSEENEIDQIVTQAVQTIERICIPVLRMEKPSLKMRSTVSK